MKVFFFLFISYFSRLSFAETPCGEVFTSFKDLQWNYRVLIVVSEDERQTQELLEDASRVSEELVERKLAVLVFEKAVLEKEKLITFPYQLAFTDEMVKQVKMLSTKANATLLGLDGGIKQEYEIVDWPTIFRHIDGMPMRKAELKK